MATSIRNRLGYLFWCANEHQEFRIPEFEALGKLFNFPLKWVEKNEREPWVILDLESEEQAKQLISRSIATKYCIEIWGDAKDNEALHESVKSYPSELSDPFFREDKSFKVYVEAFMNKLSFQDKIQRIESFNYLPVKGPVKMKNPDVTYSFFEYWGLDHNNLPDSPLRYFFGRCIGDGQRELITKLSIKNRKFIGKSVSFKRIQFSPRGRLP